MDKSSKNDSNDELAGSVGQRLRHFRLSEVSESRDKFISSLGITARTLERYENDESAPDSTFLSNLNAKYMNRLNLDWLLTGRGDMYIQSEHVAPALQQEAPEYQDAALARMTEQLRRIYEERNFSKLAALQSLMNLIDPAKEEG